MFAILPSEREASILWQLGMLTIVALVIVSIATWGIIEYNKK